MIRRTLIGVCCLLSLTVSAQCFQLPASPQISAPPQITPHRNGRIPKEEIIVNGFDYSTNHINTAHRYFPAIDGSNTVVSVKEEGPDTTDIDLRGRFLKTPLQSPRISDHATTMSTIIAGGGNSYYTAGGVAPAAQLTSSSFDQLTPDNGNAYRSYHISVQNHSYGTGIENYYGTESAAYDSSVIDNPSLLHVFSAGNSGDQADSIGRYRGLTGWANLTGNFKMAKNILTVGSIDSFYQVPLLSSKGPAYDGRVKPELVAYGEDGSSGAAALVSGTALLLQQAWRQRHGDSLPSAALVKAFLLNSARSDKSGISFSSGYGSLDAWRALKELTADHYFSGNMVQGQEARFSLTVPAQSLRLKILLCWTDPPASPNTPTALVNDLDLSLSAAGATTPVFLPWVLNSAPDTVSLTALPVRKRDSLNNVEQITIDTPAAGDFTIRVSASRLATPSQSFFIVYEWDTTNAFQWMYPTAVDNLLPATPNLLRWQTSSASPALLEYRLIGEDSWTRLATIAPTPETWFSWTPPDTTALALLRVTIDQKETLSDTFTIAPRLLTDVGFACPDSFLLYWNRNPAGAYILYQLGDQYLQSQQMLTDTAVILPAGNPAGGSPSSWYAIAPFLSGYKPALRSYAFDYTKQGVGCYISSFTADRNGTTARLQLDLGSDYRVASVTIAKLAPSRPPVILPPGALSYTLTDSNLTQGQNIYRATIGLSNGRQIFSDLQTVYYPGSRSWFIYPNPVQRPQPIHILASDLRNPVFRLFTLSGQLIMEKILTQLEEDIPTDRLSRGFYFYSLSATGSSAMDAAPVRGKLVVL